MTISIFPLTNRLGAHVTVALTLFTISALSNADNSISSVTLSSATNKHFDHYNIHNGQNPQFVNVVTEFKNGTPSNTVTLEIIPVVGLTGWVKNEGITDLKLLEKSKQAMGSVYTERTLVDTKTNQLMFSSINLKSIINDYASRQLWPREMIFRVSIPPSNQEIDLKNNVVERILILDPAD